MVLPVWMIWDRQSIPRPDDDHSLPKRNHIHKNFSLMDHDQTSVPFHAHYRQTICLRGGNVHDFLSVYLVLIELYRNGARQTSSHGLNEGD
jgi:hypothetical protein